MAKKFQSFLMVAAGLVKEALVHFVKENWTLQQRLVRLWLLGKTVCGDEIARELVTILSTELGIAPGNLLAAMRDRASTNQVAVCTLKVVYPYILDIGCFSHTIDHVGKHFVTPLLGEFTKPWI